MKKTKQKPQMFAKSLVCRELLKKPRGSKFLGLFGKYILLCLITISIGFCNFSLCWSIGKAPNMSVPNENKFDNCLIAFPWQPITSKMVLPNTFPIPASSGETLYLRACRGEYEPTSVILRAKKSCSNVRIVASNLKGPRGSTIDSSSIDIRLVKCWYQAGAKTHRQTGTRVLVPELLLHDDNLIHVDYSRKKNFLRVRLEGKEQFIDISSPNAIFPIGAEVRDSPVLKPFNLQRDRNKQVWITIKVPKDTPSGKYIGRILVYTEQVDYPVLELKLIVEVLPFDLEEPLLEYAIYYRGKIPKGHRVEIGSEWKSPKQYEAELRDIKNHGIQYPTIYQRMDVRLDQAFSIRSKIGLPNDKIYVLGLTSGNPKRREKVIRLKNKVKTWLVKAAHYGYKEVYIYGMDEAKGKRLKSERPAWRSIHNAGGKVFVACSQGAVDIVGDLLDVAVLHGKFKKKEVKKWHKHGKRVLIYSNPQVGIENPEIYRKNYGLALLNAGYDGAMPYAYQHNMGHIWNDFDHPRYRDLVFSYPTSDGVINTVQWEGLREGIDDVRYFSTLLKLLRQKNKKKLHTSFALLLSHKDTLRIRQRIIADILSIVSSKGKE